MQMVSSDNLHEMSNPVFWKKNMKNIINLLADEFAYIQPAKCQYQETDGLILQWMTIMK